MLHPPFGRDSSLPMISLTFDTSILNSPAVGATVPMMASASPIFI